MDISMATLLHGGSSTQSLYEIRTLVKTIHLVLQEHLDGVTFIIRQELILLNK